jgi:hypothetical protein
LARNPIGAIRGRRGVHDAFTTSLHRPEVGIQFGAGGATATEELAAERTRDPDWAIRRARCYLEAGAD